MTAARLVIVGRRAGATPEIAALVAVVRDLVARLPELEVRVILQDGGPLLGRFETLAPTVVVSGLSRRSPAALVERVLGAVRARAAAQRWRGARLGLSPVRGGDVVYLHTVMTVQVLRYARTGAARVVCRVPEAAHPLDQPLSEPDLRLLLDRVSRFLPVTAVGAEELRAEHGVRSDRLVRVAETVVLGEDQPVPSPAELDELRRSLGIDADTVVVGSFGASAVEPPSPATSLAVALRRHGSAAVLLHVAPEHASDGWARHDVECAELWDRVVVVQADDPLSPYVALCDVVVHAGWGPDHPLAYLEAAARGVPIVCFAGHELAEVVGDDEAGFVCPYLDLDAMADRLAELVDDADLRTRLGAAARERVGISGGRSRVADAVAALVGESAR